MRNLYSCALLLLLLLGVYCCSDNNSIDDNVTYYTVSEECETKGSTAILSGLGTYKTGKNVTIKAKSGAQISGSRTSGSGSFSSTYESGGYACADINDIHGDWTVSASIPDYTVTVKAGAGGTANGGGIVEKGSSVNISATPSSGYSFNGWSLTSGSGSFGSTSASTTTFKPNSNCTVTANFVQDTPQVIDVFVTISVTTTMNGIRISALHDANTSLPAIVLSIEQWIVNSSGTAVHRDFSFSIPAGSRSGSYLIPNTDGYALSNGECHGVSPTEYKSGNTTYKISASRSW